MHLPLRKVRLLTLSDVGAVNVPIVDTSLRSTSQVCLGTWIVSSIDMLKLGIGAVASGCSAYGWELAPPPPPELGSL